MAEAADALGQRHRLGAQVRQADTVAVRVLVAHAAGLRGQRLTAAGHLALARRLDAAGNRSEPERGAVSRETLRCRSQLQRTLAVPPAVDASHTSSRGEMRENCAATAQVFSSHPETQQCRTGSHATLSSVHSVWSPTPKK